MGDDSPLLDDDLPEPEAAARAISEAFVDADPPESAGARHDRLIGAAADANQIAWELKEVYVTLDVACDDLGLLPEAAIGDIRGCQRALGEYASWVEAFAQALEDQRREVGDGD